MTRPPPLQPRARTTVARPILTCICLAGDTSATAVAEGSLVLLRADWTRPDADIAAFLASHGRYGIPFNMLLTPAGRADTVFAEILTSSAIIEALENAAQTAK